jgi:DNA-binding MarR family transcriptional regulator/N-acetylglutamate synthase-like GNAT family acetyltransferase
MGGVNLDAEEMRAFNRFYTQRIGVLHERLLGSDFSLTEVRLMFEIAARSEPVASEIARDLAIDAGYLSRILTRLVKLGLVERTKSATDARRSPLRLTKKGAKTFAALDSKSHEEIAALLSSMSEGERARLVAAMGEIRQLLGAGERRVRADLVVVREPRAGDFGWVVHRHGALYWREYGWDATFEALVAKIVGEFVERFDPARERCWIAEQDGRIVGSVFLVKYTKTAAKLRLLFVEPEARGAGIGRRLVEECVRFAREVGYKKITLWTQSVLGAARHVYAQAGFELVREEPNRSFGHDLVSETWELEL